jgi:tetratricopeptide (TPR) repeat protein
MQDGVERHNLGPKPTVIVASPVPISEITFKQKRLNELEKRLGIKPLTLSYHPLLALMESIFVRDYSDVQLALEYARLTAVLMMEVADEARQLAGKGAVEWIEPRPSPKVTGEAVYPEAAAARDWASTARGALRLAPQAPEIGFSLLGQLFRAKAEGTDLPLQRRLSAVLAEDAGNRRAALNNWGNALADEARATSGPKADLFFQAAYRRYEEALKLDSNYFPALINWGSALSDQAKSKSGSESDALYTKALEIFAEALRLKRDEHVVLNNWGAALHDWGKTNSGVEAHRRFAEANAKYDEATRMNPGYPQSFFNWGNLLSDQAAMASPDKARALYADAAKKYEHAYTLDPSYRWTLSNWGNALYRRAKLEDAATADRLFAEAGTKFQEALKAFPDFAEAANNWGAALSEQAHTKSGEEAMHCLQQACVHFENALRLKPDLLEARTNLADALTRQSKIVPEEIAVQLAHTAIENAEIAAKQRPTDGTVLNIWGNALTQLARLQHDRWRELFEEATSKYAQAIALNPSDPEAHYNWGTAVFELAKESSADVEFHLNQAIEKYTDAIRLKPEFYEALNNLGAALVHLARLETPPESEALLDEALSKLTRAEELSPGSGAFNLACLEARRGNPAAAVKWLDTLRSLGRPVPRDQLIAESDFAIIRQSPEFTAFLESSA